jgi:hypothetical protein
MLASTEVLCSRERCCATIYFPHARQKRTLPSEVNTYSKWLKYWSKRELTLDFTCPILVNKSQTFRHSSIRKLQYCEQHLWRYLAVNTLHPIAVVIIALLISRLVRENARGWFPVCQQASRTLLLHLICRNPERGSPRQHREGYNVSLSTTCL